MSSWQVGPNLWPMVRAIGAWLASTRGMRTTTSDADVLLKRFAYERAAEARDRARAEADLPVDEARLDEFIIRLRRRRR